MRADRATHSICYDGILSGQRVNYQAAVSVALRHPENAPSTELARGSCKQRTQVSVDVTTG